MPKTYAKKRLVVATLLSLITGLLCAYMATIRQPVPITFWVLVAAVYTRTLAGFLIGLKPLSAHPLLRGAVLGFIVSPPLALPYGLGGALGFSIFGAIYGAIIDYIVSKMEKE